MTLLVSVNSCQTYSFQLCRYYHTAKYNILNYQLNYNYFIHYNRFFTTRLGFCGISHSFSSDLSLLRRSLAIPSYSNQCKKDLNDHNLIPTNYLANLVMPSKGKTQFQVLTKYHFTRLTKTKIYQNYIASCSDQEETGLDLEQDSHLYCSCCYFKSKPKPTAKANREIQKVKDALYEQFLQQKQLESLQNTQSTNDKTNGHTNSLSSDFKDLSSSTSTSSTSSTSSTLASTVNDQGQSTLDFSQEVKNLRQNQLSFGENDLELEKDISSLLESVTKEQLELLKARCRDKLYNLFGVYKRKFDDNKIKEPKLSFDLQSRTIAGLARYPDKIELNLKFLIQEGEHFIDNVVGHEFAHYLVFYLIANKKLPPKVKPHGKEWKYFMTLFGIEPNVYHSYDVEHRVKRNYRYVCSCQEHFLTATRHNRVKKGIKYSCRKCKEILRFEPLNRASLIEDPES